MKTEKKYSGVVVPMMTPFTEGHKIDTAGVQKLVDHITAGKASPFILGTTGEAASISARQKKVLVAETVKAAKGETLVYAGISGNSFDDTLEEGKAFYDLGADVLVTTMPSYYPVDADQMLRYFGDLADKLQLPLIIYNIPSTTHLSIPLEIVDRLSAHSSIVGFKDSEKGTERITAATGLWKNREDFSYLLGWALMSQMALEQGADGIVPSSGNLIPAVYRKIYDAARSGNAAEAAQAQRKADLVSELYQKDRILSKSLAAFKAMLSGYHLCSPHVLPPLYRLPEEQQLIKDMLENFGSLININSIKP